MNYEKSCGAVVFTRIGGIIHYVIIKEKRGSYGFPKGHREPGESEKQTALREIWEEVHLRPRLLDGFYIADEKLRPKTGCRKTTVFFLGEYEDQELKLQQEELESGALLPFDQALRTLQYPFFQQVLRAADAFLKQMEKV